MISSLPHLDIRELRTNREFQILLQFFEKRNRIKLTMSTKAIDSFSDEKKVTEVGKT